MSYTDAWDVTSLLADPPNWTDIELFQESALGIRRATRRLLRITKRRDAALARVRRRRDARRER